MPYILNDYDDVLLQILDHGKFNTNARTGEATISLHGVQCKYDVSGYFPALTRRKLNFSANMAELLWFIEGSTNINRLVELGCNYWNLWRNDEFTAKNAFADGSIGMSYGYQLRYFGQSVLYFQDNIKINNPYYNEEQGVDQLENMINGIEKDPSDRGLIINLWNAADLKHMRLRPCAYSFQVLITGDTMDGILVQRSADWPVGVPYNISFYTAFLHILAYQTGYLPGTLTHQVGSAHVYVNQVPQAKQYLSRPIVNSPKLTIKKRESIDQYQVSDFVLENYVYCAPDIKFDVAV